MLKGLFAGGVRFACTAIPVLLGALVLATSPGLRPAAAQEFLSSHGAWNVIRYVEGASSHCYIHAAPVKETGNYARRGDAYVLVIHGPGQGASDQVSLSSGYPYKEGSEVEVTIGSLTFNLFIRGEKAWTRTPDDDRALIQAMIKEREMTVRGTSWKDTYSLDTYSLIGFTRAHQEIATGCE